MKVRVTLSDGFKTALVIMLLGITLIFCPRNYSEKPEELVIPKFPTDLYYAQVKVESKQKEVPIVEVKPEPDEDKVSQEEVELLALLTMAEAEGESEKGKRLVIDTVLNRVDSKHFPNTISDVIYQKNQFSSMWNGRVDRCYVKEDIVQLVHEELETRMNTDVVFFRAGKYGRYGTPMFQEGNHYFSSY